VGVDGGCVFYWRIVNAETFPWARGWRLSRIVVAPGGTFDRSGLNPVNLWIPQPMKNLVTKARQLNQRVVRPLRHESICLLMRPQSSFQKRCLIREAHILGERWKRIVRPLRLFGGGPKASQ